MEISNSNTAKTLYSSSWIALNLKFLRPHVTSSVTHCPRETVGSGFKRHLWMDCSKVSDKLKCRALRRRPSLGREVMERPMKWRRLILGSVSLPPLVYLVHGLQWKRMDCCSALPRCVTVRVQLGDEPTDSLTWGVWHGLGKCQTM